MSKNVSLFVDFSENTPQLIANGLSLAKEVGATLRLVHLTKTKLPAITDHESRKAIRQGEKKDAREQLRALVSDIGTEGQKIDFLVSEAELPGVLPQLSDGGPDNLMMVGMKGTGFLKSLFLGSFALKLMEISPYPILALPIGAYRFSPTQLLVAYTDAYPFNRNAFESVLSVFGEQLKALSFFHLIDDRSGLALANANLAGLVQGYTGRYNVSYKVFENEIDPEILKTIVGEEAGRSLVLQKGPRELTDQLTRKFMIDHMIKDGSVPMFILP